MVDTGIKRGIDVVGRIVLPKELRKTLQIEIGDSLEVYVDMDEKAIYLRKHESGCVFCGYARGTVDKMGKQVCRECLEEIVKSV